MRNRFAKKITQLASKDDRIVLLSGDIGNRLFDQFKLLCPSSFFNCGVAEQNMTGMAAGLAKQGFLPFTYTIAPFCTTRCLEQIKIDVAYHNLPVTVVSVGSGLSYAGLGPTHHALEDISCLRSIPNMRVLNPADSDELDACLELVVSDPKPTYIRMGKKGEPLIHNRMINKIEISNPIPLSRGNDVCLIGSGTILAEVTKAADLLSKRGVSASVFSLPMIKPLCKDVLTQQLHDYKVVVIFEEHALAGGVGSALAELYVDSHVKGTQLLRFGVCDNFYTESGSQKYARERLGLTAERFAEQILSKMLGKKNEDIGSNIDANRQAS
jgi:transketolase